MTRFRPCIDIHNRKVKQIVGGSLDLSNADSLRTNFESEHPSSYYATLYRDNQLTGAHVILLGPGNDQVARDALDAWPQALQVGGGVSADNAGRWLLWGAEKV